MSSKRVFERRIEYSGAELRVRTGKNKKAVQSKLPSTARLYMRGKLVFLFHHQTEHTQLILRTHQDDSIDQLKIEVGQL